MEMSSLLQVINVFVLILVEQCGAINLSDDLRRLAETLPGVYSNNARHSGHLHSTHNRPLGSQETPAPALTTIPLRAIYRPVEVTFLKDDFNVYVEQTVQGESKPHRRWLYSFSKDERTRSIKLRIYNFNDDSIIEKIAKNPRAIKYLSGNDVTTRSNCDMFWRRLGETFVGTTSRQCQAVVDTKQVRISIMTTLTSSSLQIDEGWYNVKDGSKVTELDGPIFLTKIEPILDNPFLGTDEQRAGDPRLEKDSEELPLLQKDGRKKYSKTNEIKEVQKNTYRVSQNNVPNVAKKYNTIDKPYATKSDDLYNRAIEKAGFSYYGNVIEDTRNRPRKIPTSNEISTSDKQQTSMWNLQTYEGVLDALTSGHKVYFSAKTKHCSNLNGARKKDKSFVGDYVDIFEIHRDFSEKQPNKFVQFSLRRTEYNRKGIFDVITEVTTHRNGSVHMRTVHINDDKRVHKHYSIECELYNEITGKGSVRFFLDPYRDVSQITRNKVLMTSLQNGHLLRITTEVDKCRGGQADHVILGGEVRSYDLGRNGKTLDFSLQSPRLVQAPGSGVGVEEHLYMFSFPRRGEVSVLRHRRQVTSLQSDLSVVNGYRKYRCETDVNSSTRAITVYNT
ncbi:uncharacterized protein LOC128244656 [Mya arenaria]|uniref:uncharacterized protein LOC128244656 n=1 Tax=Mya arenaria TaxID=6604 RepID=UPI0022DECB9D|nr:uncharacterized protein LOC128244656 [Mya arenaria]